MTWYCLFLFMRCGKERVPHEESLRTTPPLCKTCKAVCRTRSLMCFCVNLHEAVYENIGSNNTHKVAVVSPDTYHLIERHFGWTLWRWWQRKRVVRTNCSIRVLLQARSLQCWQEHAFAHDLQSILQKKITRALSFEVHLQINPIYIILHDVFESGKFS